VNLRLRNILKWLYPGIRVKRWLILLAIGIVTFGAGMALALGMQVLDVSELLREIGGRVSSPTLAGAFVAVGGTALIILAVRQLVRSIAAALRPSGGEELVDILYQKRRLEQGERIVVIGGGTGLSTLLRGLKEFTGNLTALVTVSDDGGSSGRLQKDLGVLPPGDIRNCLVALADVEPLMTHLFQYRFDGDTNGLGGHSFGNLLIAAMTSITGNFEQAIKETSKVLAIRGRVLPATLEDVVLCAECNDGSMVEGETAVSRCGQIKRVFLRPGSPPPLAETIEAIQSASIIVIGPGSLYTSIIPNLLVRDIPETIAASDAVKIYVCNVMTQPGESDGLSASGHLRAILEHIPQPVFDFVLVNNAVPSPEILRRYREQGAELVRPDVDEIARLGFVPIAGDYLSRDDYARHDPHRLATAILSLAMEEVRVH